MKKAKPPKSFEVYWEQVTGGKPAEAKEIDPRSVVTAPWVRLKCLVWLPQVRQGVLLSPGYARTGADQRNPGFLPPRHSVSSQSSQNQEREPNQTRRRLPCRSCGSGRGDVQEWILQGFCHSFRPLHPLQGMRKVGGDSLPLRVQSETFHGSLRD